MDWFRELLFTDGIAHTVLVICMAIFPGVWLGRCSIGKVKLGIAGVLFAGLFVGYWNLPMNKEILDFVRDFGLILFVFAVGLQSGPGFFANFRNQGLKLNAMAATIVLLGSGIAVLLHKIAGLPIDTMVGLLSGAVTNTPGLGAATQTLKDLPNFGPPAIAQAGSAYAVAYPFGICGIILTMLLVRWFFRVKIEQEAESVDSARRNQGFVSSRSLRIQNPMLQGKTIAQFSGLAGIPVAVSRMRRNGTTWVPTDEEALQTDDDLQIVCSKNDVEKLSVLAGPQAPEDVRKISNHLAVRKIVVSRVQGLEDTLAEMRLPERHRCRVTRVLRAGIEFVPTAGTSLHIGDMLTVVGADEDLEAVVKELGNSLASLDRPNMLAVFMGIMLGVLVGSVPIALPGLPAPAKLGLAGGPLLVAILMGYKRRIGPIDFHMSTGANLFMHEIGIVLFLGAVGLGSGKAFVQMLTSIQGVIWMGYGALITFVPLFLVAMYARWRGMNYLTITGMLAGSMTDPPALGYANSLSPSQAQSVGYASVYPLTMFLRVVTAQVIVMLLAR